MSDPGSNQPPDDLGGKKTVRHEFEATGPPIDETRLTGAEDKVEIVPGYLLLDKLGEGGMGVVYKALQKSLNRVIALKMMRSYDDESFVARFRREAIAGAKINHPNIVAVYDHGTAHGAVYLVMEFVEGRNCADLVRSQGRVAPDTAFQIIKGSVLGLGHAFEQGVIHRDIKPANIMLDEGGSSDPFGVSQVVVKIGDFGLARLRDAGAEAPDLTQTGSVMGTPGYMAPEQSLGREVDFRADIYSLGITSYYLITGKRPFSGQTAMDIFHQKMSGSAVNPRDYVPELPEGTVRVVARMMARDPEDRYQSYAELLKDVDHILSEREPESGEVPPASQSIAEPSEGSSITKRKKKAPEKAGMTKVVRATLLTLVLIAIGVSAAILATRDDGGDGKEGGGSEEAAAGGGTREETVATPWKSEPDDVFLRNLATHLSSVAGHAEARRALGEHGSKVLEKRRLEIIDGLANLHSHAEYGKLATAVQEASEPYDQLQLPLPKEVREFRQIVDAAMRDGAGREERRVLEQVEAETDSRKIVTLLDGFEDRFPFSPSLDVVRSKLEEAHRDVAAAEASTIVERAERSWREGRYTDVAAAVKDCEVVCGRAKIDEPGELKRFREIVEQAVDGGLGAEERDVWRRANSSDADAETVAELLGGFAAKFPFSPVLAPAAALLADAESKTTLLSLKVMPATAQVYVDRLRVTEGSISKRFLNGKRVVEVKADGHHPARREVKLEGDDLTLNIRLGPRPARPLNRKGRRNRPLLRSFRAWKGGGFAYSSEQAALIGESSGDEWKVNRRELSGELAHDVMKGATGWCIVLYLERSYGDAEVRLADGPGDRRAVFGMTDGKIYVGERRGDELEIWVERPWKRAGKRSFSLSWHGDVLAVTDGIEETGDYLGSVAPDWSVDAEPGIEIAVRNGSCAFGEIVLHPLD